MKPIIALLIGALFVFPALARAQSASPSPSAAASALPAASASPPAPAPVDTPSLSVPADWTPKAYTANMGNFTLIKMWYRPDGGGDNINLGYSPNPTGAGLEQVVPLVKMGLAKMLGSGNVTDHPEKVCNGTVNGWLFLGNAAFGAYHMIVEEVILPSKHQIFGATYTRMSTHAEDPAARKALDTLCVNA